ncbi:hypothetical protein [Paenibacillus sp. GYB003]|uniref:hypothetical protein n=1 Tax=Paenibacillus sp. GYB003 TaxID=2994392 RepID=UPI002F965FD6
MSEAPIYFEFPDTPARKMALDTLKELGYHAHGTELGGKPGVQVFIDSNDLTSALEIAQASGGLLVETEDADAEPESYRLAYDLDAVPIPAHIVGADWPESYYTEGGDATTDARGEADAGDAPFDPSGDDYDHFSAGVRL